jgi:hypothetical protein
MLAHHHIKTSQNDPRGCNWLVLPYFIHMQTVIILHGDKMQVIIYRVLC